MKSINRNKVKNIKILYFLAIVMSFTVLFGCGNSQEDNIQKKESKQNKVDNRVELTEAQYKDAGIEVGKIENKSLSDVLKVNGVTDSPPQNQVSISAPIGGFVVSTKLLQGMKISKGQLLVTMENSEYVQLQQDYLDKKSNLEYLEQEYKRQEDLNKENVNSNKIFQRAKSDYISMKVQVKGLKEKLAFIGVDVTKLTEDNLSRIVSIYSPINGYVTEVNVNSGKYVNPKDVMFEIVNTEHLFLKLTVYENDIVKLKIGQKVRFSLPNEMGKESVATITLIGRKIGSDRSLQVFATLESEDLHLLPGMYVNALIELNNNRVLAIPEEAIVMSEGKHYVYIVKNEKIENDKKVYNFEMMEVKKGVTETGYSEVSFAETVGKENIQIVVKGAFSLLAKMKNYEDDEGHSH